MITYRFVKSKEIAKFIVTAAMLDDWQDHQTQLGSMEKILEKNYDHQQQVMAKAQIWALAR
jgi:hypothetical protein